MHSQHQPTCPAAGHLLPFFWGVIPPTCATYRLMAHYTWLQSQLADPANHHDPFWQAMRLVTAQLQGMLDGYNAFVSSKEGQAFSLDYISLREWLALNTMGEELKGAACVCMLGGDVRATLNAALVSFERGGVYPMHVPRHQGHECAARRTSFTKWPLCAAWDCCCCHQWLRTV